MRILGIDPGIHGGLAIVAIVDGAAAQLIDAVDIPVVGTGAKERVDVLAIRTWILTHPPQHALIERAQAMPKQGASSGFKYGRATGALEGVLACCEIPMTIVEPSAWKKSRPARQRQGDEPPARIATLSKPTLLARAPQRSRSRRSSAHRADGNKVSVQSRRRRRGRDFSATRRLGRKNCC
jgi:hypothetical protein